MKKAKRTERESQGTVIAAKLRAECNRHTREEWAANIAHAMSIIYGDATAVGKSSLPARARAVSLRGMSTSMARLTREVFTLPRHQRLALASRILSIDASAPEAGAGRAWEEEIRRRLETVKNGTAKTVPYEDVMAEMERLPVR